MTNQRLNAARKNDPSLLALPRRITQGGPHRKAFDPDVQDLHDHGRSVVRRLRGAFKCEAPTKIRDLSAMEGVSMQDTFGKKLQLMGDRG